jgi:hypothetical protein
MVPGAGVVQVAAGSGLPAPGRGAPGAAGGDQVPQPAAGPVAVLGLGVGAGAADDDVEGELEGAQELRRPRAAGRERAGGPGMPARGAAVRGGGAVGVQRGQALVELTEHGASVLEAIRAARGTEAERVFGRLSQTDRAHLARILRKLSG